MTHRPRRSPLYLLPALLALGCQITADEEATDASPVVVDGALTDDGAVNGSDAQPLDALRPDAHGEPPMESGFDVHEWGLIRFLPSGADLSTSGYGFFVEDDITADKPLIYFHPQAGFDPNTEISARISAEGGRMREMWPDGGEISEDRAAYTWPSFKIQPNVPCGVEDVPTLGTFGDAGFCGQFMSGVCETAEMHAYLSETPHCLAFDHVKAPVLLYNAYTNPQHTAPIVFEASPRSVRNVSGGPVGPLWIAAEGGSGLGILYRLDTLAAGEAVEVDSLAVAFNTQAHQDFIADVRAALIDAGLAGNEADDFINAWRPNVLRDPNMDYDSAYPGGPMLYTPWSALGFYSQDAVDQLYPLEINPAPARVARVMGFTVNE